MPVLPQTTIITTSGSPNATVGNKTGLMTCQGIYSANTLSTGTGTTISTCGGVATCGTACTSTSIVLSANATAGDGATPTAMNVSAQPLTSTFLDGTNGAEFDGVNGSILSSFPSSIAIGDINGDGINDIVTSTGSAGGIKGGTYVIFGRTSGWPTTPQQLTVPGYIDGINGFRISRDYQVMAGSVAVGDVNGDGIADFIVGSQQCNGFAGCAILIFGHANPWPADTTPSALWLNGINGVEFDGVNAWDLAGGSSLAIGDISGDGVKDIMLGASGFPGGTNVGAVYVFFGKRNNWPTSPFNLGGHSPGGWRGPSDSEAGSLLRKRHGPTWITPSGQQQWFGKAVSRISVLSRCPAGNGGEDLSQPRAFEESRRGCSMSARERFDGDHFFLDASRSSNWATNAGSVMPNARQITRS